MEQFFAAFNARVQAAREEAAKSREAFDAEWEALNASINAQRAAIEAERAQRQAVGVASHSFHHEEAMRQAALAHEQAQRDHNLAVQIHNQMFGQ